MSKGEFKIGDKVWAMVGRWPVPLEIFDINKPTGRFPNIWLVNKHTNSVYSRYEQDLHRSYSDLRDYVFPELDVPRT